MYFAIYDFRTEDVSVLRSSSVFSRNREIYEFSTVQEARAKAVWLCIKYNKTVYFDFVGGGIFNYQ